MKKQELSELLLKWYNAHGRTLPWRVKGGAHPDPYVVLVSEFMLQQTTVKTVLDYFPGFLKRFPTAESLAAADLEEVYRYWQGSAIIPAPVRCMPPRKPLSTSSTANFPKTGKKC